MLHAEPRQTQGSVAMNDRRQRPNRTTRTTVGDLVAAAYEAALAEVGDSTTARRLAAVVVEDLLTRVNR